MRLSGYLAQLAEFPFLGTPRPFTVCHCAALTAGPVTTTLREDMKYMEMRNQAHDGYSSAALFSPSYQTKGWMEVDPIPSITENPQRKMYQKGDLWRELARPFPPA